MVDEPLIALIEGVGACIALLLLRPLTAPARPADGPPYLRSIAVAFAVVGTLDLVHACATSPEGAAWTRTVSALVGGLSFAVVALTPRRTQRRGGSLPALTIVACAALGITVARLAPSLPALRDDGHFKLAALALNLTGAAGYLIAARVFGGRARRHAGELGRADAQALAIACFAFGMANVALLVVPRWSALWWLFHAVQLGGYLVVVRRVVVRAQRACAELGAARRDLERVRTLTDELALEKRAREEFVAGLAHDLRNPVHAAGLAAELLASGEVDPSQRDRCAARISTSLRRVQRMIEDFLDANRVTGGHPLPLQLGRCDLVALAREVIADFGADGGDRFVLVAPPELIGWWWAKGLRRLLENLVSNAIKYGDAQAPVTIRIDARGDRVALSVHNQGRALSPAEQRAIFAPFARTPAAEASGERGWGIGLTLVRGTAEAHGGGVTVRSQPGEGTLFTVELPRDARSAAVDPQPASTISARV